MKRLVEFKLHAGYVPYFIKERCGLFCGAKLVGVTHDDVDCYVPNTVVILTTDQVVTMAEAETVVKECDPISGELTYYSVEEKRALAQEWLAANA